MDKRVRSPNYPALSLPEAVDKVSQIYRNNHTHAAPREVIAKAMGYAGLNGASATAISALHKYGLLEKVGAEEIKVSERSMSILHPNSPEEKSAAIREASREPQLFLELAERFPGKMPNEELLKNYLIRKGFASAALSSVISAYRDTSDMVEREGVAYTDGVNNEMETPMAQPSATYLPAPTKNTSNILIEQNNERQVGRYDFEGGAYVRIGVYGDIDTDTALDMVQTIVDLKRKELGLRNKKTSSPMNSSN